MSHGNQPISDPVEEMLKKTGCINLHYKVQECIAESQDWRKCQAVVKEFRQCMQKYRGSPKMIVKIYTQHQEILLGVDKSARGSNLLTYIQYSEELRLMIRHQLLQIVPSKSEGVFVK